MPDRWTAESIPSELAAILDEQAGKVHSPGGSVRRCLADILNRYDELRDERACALAEEALAAEAGPEWARIVRGDQFRVEIDDRIRPGMFVMASTNVGALDLESGEIAVVDPDDDDDGQRYGEAVNAPLSDATIAALNKALTSGDYPRYKRRRRDEPQGDGDA